MGPLLFERLAQFIRVFAWSSVRLPPILFRRIFKSSLTVAKFLALSSWDSALFFVNIFTPQLTKGTVVKPGKAGHGGLWPEFIPPTSKDSRSPCPGLNAMANHGILPRDGRGITMKALRTALEDTFNFSPTLTLNTTNSLKSTYGRDEIDLDHLSAHNLVEHDASFLRHDAHFDRFESDQAVPAKDLIQKLFTYASGPVSKEHPEGYLTPGDLSRFFSLRIAQSKRDNPVFSLSLLHKFFGASNATLLYESLGGDVEKCRTFLIEERFPEGFETSMRQRAGFTMVEFHLRSAEIALGLQEIKL